MAQITTSTQTDVLPGPNVSAIFRCPASGRFLGNLFSVVRTGADTLTAYRSTNNGASWTTIASFTHSSLQEWSTLIVDSGNRNAHLVYRVNTGSADIIYYRRLDIVSGAWGGAVQGSATDANGGVAGSRWQGVDIMVYWTSSYTYILWCGGYNNGAGKAGACLASITLNNTTLVAVASHGQLISGNRFWLSTVTGRYAPSIEIEHGGDGYFRLSTPNVWITFGRTSLQSVKCAWNGTGWTGPTSPSTLLTPLNVAHNYIPGRWDGVRWLSAVINPDDSTTVLVLQRNQGNTSTTTLTATPVHPTGIVTDMALSYDYTSKDVRVYAVGTSTDVLYFTTYNRLTTTWAAWATVTATAVLNGGSEFSVRKGGTNGNSEYDVVTAHSGAPNTIVSTAQTVSSQPNLPVWDTSAQPYVNGGAADVAAALSLTWIFSDPDAGQTQGSYALSRQIGTGTIAYWNAGTSTWVASEVQNATGTTGVTLPTAWGLDADAPHNFRVKVWDNTGSPSAGYGPTLQLNPSTKVNPTMTGPAATISTDTATVTWTVSAQTSFRVRLLSGSVAAFDSGYITDASSLSYVIPVRLANGTSWTAELTTRNTEGLASTAQTRAFTVSYTPPPAPISTLTPLPALGVMRVTASQLAVVGTQPATTAMALFRRVNATPTLNANPTMAGNITGWAQGGGGAAGTLSYSTTQFAPGSSPGAARYVPPAAAGAADQGVESTAFTPIVTGNLYWGSAWIRPDTAAKPIKVRLMWYNASNVFISSTDVTFAAPVAAAWHWLEIFGDPAAVAGATQVRVYAGAGSTPATADAFYVDDVELMVYDPTVGVPLADGLAPGSTVDDSGAVSGVDYAYRWVATGANGATIAGPWTA